MPEESLGKGGASNLFSDDYLPASRGCLRVLTAFQRYPRFRYLWASNLLFFTGAWMQTVVMAWLIYQLTESVFLLGLFTTIRLFPMLFGPIGGLLADRVDRPRFLLWVQFMVLLVALVIAILVLLDRVQYWHLLLGGFLTGLGQTPSQPARATMVMEIVGRRDLSNATALNTLTLNSSQITGAAVGSAALAVLGAGPALAGAALCFLLSAANLVPLRKLDRDTEKAGSSALGDLIDGFRVVLRSREMMAVLSVTITANVFVFPVFQSFLPVFAKDILGAGPGGLGMITAAAGIGAIAGSLLIAGMGDFSWKGKLYVLGTGALGLFYALFALSQWLPVSVLLIGLAHVGGSAFGVLQTTLLLLLAPSGLGGRAIGLQGLAIGILPLATLVQALVASAIGVPLTSFIAGILLAMNMLALMVWAPSLRRLR